MDLKQISITTARGLYRIEDHSKCVLTARQYGEVVLPDTASGQDPGTLAAKLSRCKEGMAHFLLSGYKVG